MDICTISVHLYNIQDNDAALLHKCIITIRNNQHMKTEFFSAPEKRNLKQKLAQYGAIKECAEQTGIHRTTIARILKTGEATQAVIEKMRDYLRGESKVFVEEV